jgi:hypothetical protein
MSATRSVSIAVRSRPFDPAPWASPFAHKVRPR